MRIRWFSLSFFLTLSLVSSMLVAPLAVSAQAAGQQDREDRDNVAGVSFPVTGNGTAASGPVSLSGTFKVQRFVLDDGQLFAVGSLTGEVTQTATGAKTTLPERQVKLPVKSINGQPLPTGGGGEDRDRSGDENLAMLEMAQAPSCNILTLVLGPLHLDLLGLVVDLNEVVLTITGETGSGKLLGNLLCAVAGLLDHTDTLSVLTNLLNAVLDIRRLGLA